MIVDRVELACLAALAAGLAVFVFYIMPHVEIAIAIFDYFTGGF